MSCTQQRGAQWHRYNMFAGRAAPQMRVPLQAGAGRQQAPAQAAGGRRPVAPAGSCVAACGAARPSRAAARCPRAGPAGCGVGHACVCVCMHDAGWSRRACVYARVWWCVHARACVLQDLRGRWQAPPGRNGLRGTRTRSMSPPLNKRTAHGSLATLAARTFVSCLYSPIKQNHCAVAHRAAHGALGPVVQRAHEARAAEGVAARGRNGLVQQLQAQRALAVVGGGV